MERMFVSIKKTDLTAHKKHFDFGDDDAPFEELLAMNLHPSAILATLIQSPIYSSDGLDFRFMLHPDAFTLIMRSQDSDRIMNIMEELLQRPQAEVIDEDQFVTAIEKISVHDYPNNPLGYMSAMFDLHNNLTRTGKEFRME